MSQEVLSRYHRASLVPGWDQEVLAQRRAVVIGVGALGNVVAQQLVLAGVGHITLVDCDLVDVTNLNRCVLFAALSQAVEHGAQLPKVTAATQVLKVLNPHIQVTPVMANILQAGPGLVRGADIVFGCVDSIAARIALSRACAQVGASWVDGWTRGVDFKGGIGFYDAQGLNCYECCTAPADRALGRYSCSGYRASDAAASQAPTGVAAPTSAVIGALQAWWGLRFLLGHEMPYASFTYYGLADRTEVTRPQRPYDNCPSCQDRGRFVNAQSLLLSPDDSVAHLAAIVAADLGPDATLQLPGPVDARYLCPACHLEQEVYQPRAELSEAGLIHTCRDGVLRPFVVEDFAELLVDQIPPPVQLLPLHRLGFRPWDVATATCGNTRRHYQLSGPGSFPISEPSVP